MSQGYVFAGKVGSRACDDVLVGGGGSGRTVVAAIASSGHAYWSVTRRAADTGLGKVVRPATVPAVSC
jgi:hypothetical protein